MVRMAVSIVALCAIALGATPATAGEPAVPEETISGRIVDITCYGPCTSTKNGKPFEGEADVIVTEKRTGNQIARVSAKDSRYTLLAPPGRYRIVAIPYPEQPIICWLSYSRRLHVIAGQPERRILRVENGCVQ